MFFAVGFDTSNLFLNNVYSNAGSDYIPIPVKRNNVDNVGAAKPNSSNGSVFNGDVPVVTGNNSRSNSVFNGDVIYSARGNTTQRGSMVGEDMSLSKRIAIHSNQSKQNQGHAYGGIFIMLFCLHNCNYLLFIILCCGVNCRYRSSCSNGVYEQTDAFWSECGIWK